MAISAKARNPLLPDVPTFEEQGIAGIDEEIWAGLFGPRVCRTKSLGDSLPKSVQFFASEMCKI
jgi:Tripartite tricarboxylate transporter family receptor